MSFFRLGNPDLLFTDCIKPEMFDHFVVSQYKKKILSYYQGCWSVTFITDREPFFKLPVKLNWIQILNVSQQSFEAQLVTKSMWRQKIMNYGKGLVPVLLLQNTGTKVSFIFLNERLVDWIPNYNGFFTDPDPQLWPTPFYYFRSVLDVSFSFWNRFKIGS